MDAGDVKFPIVGIGASAGGVQALESFFRGVKADCGMAFVIVTHLSPDRESQLHDIVSRYTDMPVAIAQDGASVEPGWVYVLPENALLSVEKRRLHVRKPNAFQRERKPIDVFFSALAQDQAEYAVGVVLSGGAGDGTLGIKASKEHGGLTLAQVANGSGPRYPDMPQTAIASGFVDLAVPAEEMGAKLVQFARGFHLRNDRERGNDRVQAAQEAIYNILRKQTGHEFSGYKEKTFLRRVHRRMQVLQLDTLDAYVERIQQDTVEVRNLFRDLLINVTNFFRDADAFNAQRNKEEPLFLVLFIDVGPVRSRSEAESRLPRPSDADQVDLERELRDARERMQATIEEYETALEELKSTNEELSRSTRRRSPQMRSWRLPRKRCNPSTRNSTQ